MIMEEVPTRPPMQSSWLTLLVQQVLGIGCYVFFVLPYLGGHEGFSDLDGNRRYLFVSNHVSLLDTILLVGLFWSRQRVPLLVLGQVIARSLPALVDGGALDRRIGELDLLGKLTVSLGAGIFEELVFRMLLVAVLHALLVDVGRLSSSVGSIVAVTAAAAVFTWYHPLRDDAGVLSAQRIAFFFLAGLYFGGIFVLRGFGIVVAVHALYDLAVSVFLLPQSG